MTTYDELNTQNHNITELSNVLSRLVVDREMCDTKICCELFYRYVEKVTEHLNLVDKSYSILLSSSDQKAAGVANQFMAGAQELKRIFTQYQKRWCAPKNKSHALKVTNHEQFYKEIDELFTMVLKRIQDETEKLYPLIRELTGDMEGVT
ncbi:MAG TPA: hypothetical protein ENH92_02830 [Ectothiorhodospiraceae bacterium]|nr:hypothetical protein [Ectothiorhodospiraceae bacterium]